MPLKKEKRREEKRREEKRREGAEKTMKVRSSKEEYFTKKNS
jgi:hypothetical protein